MFTAKMVMNPFYTAKFTWETTERGWARRLPVELTTVNDPAGETGYLDPGPRAARPGPMDVPAFPRQARLPAGTGRDVDRRRWSCEIIVRTVDPVHHLTVTAFSPSQTVLTISAGGALSTIPIAPRTNITFDVPAAGSVRGASGWSFVLSAQSSEGFTPRLDPRRDPHEKPLKDDRNLGVQLSSEGCDAPFRRPDLQVGRIVADAKARWPRRPS
jgi:hypothetical protein